MTRDQLIAFALEDGTLDLSGVAGPGRYENSADPQLAAALDHLAGHGFADDQVGDADGPHGHAVLFERWLLRTNSQGFVHVTEHLTTASARIAFEQLSAAIRPDEIRARLAELADEIETSHAHGRDPQRQLCEVADLREELDAIEGTTEDD